MLIFSTTLLGVSTSAPLALVLDQPADSFTIEERIEQKSLLFRQQTLQDKGRHSARSSSKIEECQKHEDYINHLTTTAAKQANDSVQFLRKTQQYVSDYAHNKTDTDPDAYEVFNRLSDVAYITAAASIEYVKEITFACNSADRNTLITSTDYLRRVVGDLNKSVMQYQNTVSAQIYYLKSPPDLNTMQPKDDTKNKIDSTKKSDKSTAKNKDES